MKDLPTQGTCSICEGTGSMSDGTRCPHLDAAPTSNTRSIPGDVDLPRLVAALHELSKSFIEGNQGRYGMRIPAEPYHDGDLVCGQAARMIDLFSEQWTRRCQEVERLRAALTMMYDKWENGDACYEDPEAHDGYMGNAFKLSADEENQVLALIPRERGAAETGLKPRGKPCTCDNCLGSSCACRVDAGEQLGELWYCQKRETGAKSSDG